MERLNLENLIKDDLKKSPIVVLYGPRQVGKTTLVKTLASQTPDSFLYLDMELPSDRNKLSDIELFLDSVQNITVIIDEVQWLPELFPVLRSLVDQNRRPGRFLLLGSASPELLQSSSESLAGRIRYREIFPFSVSEIGLSLETERLWVRGGFPESLLAHSDSVAMEWMSDFTFSYIQRDLKFLGMPMPVDQINRLLQMLAHIHGQIINYSQLAKSLGISMPSIKTAVEWLNQAMLIRLIQPWQTNSGKRLVKSPKVYFRDSGMLHYFLGIEKIQDLLGHPQAGNSWEGFVVQQIISNIPRNIQVYFYRTSSGAELDAVLVKNNKIIMAIEIKLSKSPKLSRGNTESLYDLAPDQRIIIAPVSSAYPLPGGWSVRNIRDFISEMQL